jgi:hypothetical protein
MCDPTCQFAQPSNPLISESQIITIFTTSMKLIDVLLLSLAVAFLIIGIHQIMTLGLGKAYWAIMLSLILYFAFNLRKKK